MEAINFILPLHPEDLLLSTSDEKFHVHEELELDTYSESAVNKILDGVASRIKKPNFVSIARNENFDPLFGVLMKFASVQEGSLERFFEIVNTNLTGLVKVTSELLQQNTESGRDLYLSFKNALKMNIFLLHWFLNLAYKSPNRPKPTAARGKAKKAKKGEGEGPGISSWDTDTQKESFLSTLINVLDMDLSRLWKMNPEEDFINLFTKLSSMMLEESSNLKSKVVKKCIFMLLSILVKKYNQSLNITTTLTHLLHQSEHLAPVVAEFLEVLVKEHENTHIVSDLLREIGKMNPREKKIQVESKISHFSLQN